MALDTTSADLVRVPNAVREISPNARGTLDRLLGVLLANDDVHTVVHDVR